MRKFATVLLLITASAASTQPPNVPKPPAVPGYEPPSTDVPRVEEKKAEKVLPTVVFVKMKERPIAGCRVVRNDEWHTSPSVHVYPVKDGKLTDGWMWNRNADDDEIRVKAGLGVERAAPGPFGQSSASSTADGSPWLPGSEQQRLRALLPKSVTGKPLFYALTPLYQQMYTMNGGRSRFNVPTPLDSDAPQDLIVSGGMRGLHGWKSMKALDIPAGAKIVVWESDEDVRAFSLVPRKRWRFPVGTVAYDVLLNDAGEVFEARTQTRTEDGWETKVHKGEGKPPAGYAGAGQACASCHQYAGGLSDVPGRIYRHAIWGNDGRFSWRPYKADGTWDERWPIARK